MIQKTKKQHYVPRCYLEAWQIDNTYQVHVYDKKLDSIRKNSINDIASENYFYDVRPKDIFSESTLQKMRDKGFLVDGDQPSQGIEKTLANEVEGNFSKLLKHIIDQARTATPWIINNCYFISNEQKSELSAYLAIQYIRTKQVRKDIEDTADCFSQALKDMGASEELLKEYALQKGESKNIHAKMFLDLEYVSEIALSFMNLTWILAINKTKKKLYTSDNPIGTHAHVKHPFMSMSGLQSRGVEAFFPISPECVLVMFDGSYHSNLVCLERKFIAIEDIENINYYNSLCALHSERCIYSTDGDMSIIEIMKHNNPKVFNQPNTQLTWGDNKYYPSK